MEFETLARLYILQPLTGTLVNMMVSEGEMFTPIIKKLVRYESAGKSKIYSQNGSKASHGRSEKYEFWL